MLNNLKLKTGSIILFHKIGFLPFMIRFIANTDYNHAGIIVKNEDIYYNKKELSDRNISIISSNTDQEQHKYFVAEALANGVKLIPLKNRLSDEKYSKKVRIYEPTYPQFSLQNFWNDLLFIAGRNYDYSNTFWVQLIYNLTGIWLGAKTEAEALKKLNCYEVIWYIHRRTKTFTEIDGKWWKSRVNAIIKNKYQEFKIVYDSKFPHQLFI